MDPATHSIITIELRPDGFHIRNDGPITPNDLILSAFYLERTANALLSAMEATAPSAPTLEIAQTLPQGMPRQ